MDREQMRSRMKAGERFRDVRIPDATWNVLRVDGRAFSRLTEDHFRKPFDPSFRAHMLAAATALLTEMQGVLVYTQSDEISVILDPAWSMFDRSHEKLVSVAAGIASAAFSFAWGQPAHFDARVWTATNEAEVLDYVHWRQADAARCALGAWGYWTLRQAGRSASEAARMLEGRPADEIRRILADHAIDLSTQPLWQLAGTGLWWETYDKTGFDPIRHQPVTARRRRIRVEDTMPEDAALDALLRGIISVRSALPPASGATSEGNTVG